MTFTSDNDEALSAQGDQVYHKFMGVRFMMRRWDDVSNCDVIRGDSGGLDSADDDT